MDEWYVRPAKMHYRNYKFYIPETRGYIITNSAKFFLAHCKIPAIEPKDTIQLAAQGLIAAIQNRHKQARINLTPQHTEVVRQLAEIFAKAAGREAPVTNESTQIPRVHTYPSTSHAAASPRVIKAQPVTHERVTRNNQPMQKICETHDESEHTPITERPPITDRPHRTTAKYMHTAPLPNYITQEEEDNAHWSNAATQPQVNSKQAISFCTPRTPTSIDT